MRIKYSFVLLFVAFAYGIIKQYAPDFPMDDSSFLALVVFVIGLFGVQVEEGFRAQGLL